MIYICARPASIQGSTSAPKNLVSAFFWKLSSVWTMFPLSLFSPVEKAIASEQPSISHRSLPLLMSAATVIAFYSLVAYMVFQYTPEAVVQLHSDALRFLVEQGSQMKIVAL